MRSASQNFFSFFFKGHLHNDNFQKRSTICNLLLVLGLLVFDSFIFERQIFFSFSISFYFVELQFFASESSDFEMEEKIGTIVVLVRHGETNYVKGNAKMSALDFEEAKDLTDEGVEKLKETAQEIAKKYQAKHLLVSPTGIKYS